VWVALGQQANLANCQESIYMQLTGTELGGDCPRPPGAVKRP
jgi:hypothetical protein